MGMRARLRCWLFGHDKMLVSGVMFWVRVCKRCGDMECGDDQGWTTGW